MNIEYLIQLLENRLNALTLAKDQAFTSGDLGRINVVDAEILGVQDTLLKLKLLLEISSVAVAVKTTSAEVVASGIEVVQNSTQGPSESIIINGHDISAYAMDVLYEKKIQTILIAMPLLKSASDIGAYIQRIASGSPVTGEMVISATEQYSVDMPLLLAVMQNDSSFGTRGVGARTFNPGNIGNTGAKEVMLGSWDEGVKAVAKWLSIHRAPMVVIENADEIVTTPTTTPRRIQEITPPPILPTTPITTSAKDDLTSIVSEETDEVANLSEIRAMEETIADFNRKKSKK